ncbi:MAG: adenylyltransferase/cytidyltransferase family protein, partial [Roseburia sp.]|nr:adenylyltransferase/cytidyltransferase family protein [Roseburia sp.]
MIKVITYGTFDLFHEGHYRLLQRAKALGDYLIVGVTTEKYDMERGKLNVVDSLLTRVENVKKTGLADEIIIEETGGQKISDVQKYHIDIFTVGSDWVGLFDYMSDYCKVVYLERTKNISSTMLREQNRQIQKIGIIGSGRIANRFVPES